MKKPGKKPEDPRPGVPKPPAARPPSEDGWETQYDPAQGVEYRFEMEGDTVEGVYFHNFTHQGEFGPSTGYKVWDPKQDQIFLVWGTFVLDKFMRTLPFGSYVRIVYKGRAGRAHNFAVQRNQSMEKTFATKAKQLQSEAQVAPRKDADGNDLQF